MIIFLVKFTFYKKTQLTGLCKGDKFQQSKSNLHVSEWVGQGWVKGGSRVGQRWVKGVLGYKIGIFTYENRLEAIRYII